MNLQHKKNLNCIVQLVNLPTNAIWLFQKHDTSFENKNAIHLILKATHILENKKQ